MSRIGRRPSPCPPASPSPSSGATVTSRGPRAPWSATSPSGITIAQEGDTLLVSRPDDERRHRALHGLTRSLVANMVTGVTEGFTKELEIVGVGYRATAKGPSSLELALGFSHPVHVDAPEGITFEVPVPDPDHRQGHRQGEGRPGGRRHPQAPQARALQGQGRALRRRACAAQGRKGGEVMARTSDARRLRLRRHAPRAHQGGRHRRVPPPGRAPVQPAHLGPGHRRHGRPHPGRGLVGRARPPRVSWARAAAVT